MLSCQRGLLELPWGGQQCRRKGAILWWFPWPSGPGGGSHVSRPELEPGSFLKSLSQECVSQQHRPPWDVPAPRWGHRGRSAGAGQKKPGSS